MEKVNVLVLITVMDRAGAETMMMNYLRNIDRNKIQMDFLINRKQKADYEDEIERLGSRIYHMSPLYPAKFERYKSELKHFLENHPQYKIIHSHLEERSYFALKIAKKVGIPVRIVHAHSIPQEHDLKMIMRLYFRKRLKKYYTHAFACGEKPAKWLFGTTDGVTIMKNAIDTNRFRFHPEIRSKTRRQLGINDETLVVGHIGRFSPEKNQSFLLDIFQHINNRNADSQLLLIGGGKPKIEKKIKRDLMQKVEKLGLQSRVKFLGVRSDVENLLQAMDVLVMPSISEGFPVTLVEAQAVGVRCVVSEGIPLEENITGRLQYYSLSNSASDWADKILSFCHIDLDRDSMHGKVVEAGMDIKENAKWLEKFYEEQLKQREYLLGGQQKNGRNFMKVIKLWCHFKALIKKIIYRIIFGKRLHVGHGTTWRHGFHIRIEGNGKINIGNDCFFNNDCSINSLEYVAIGEGTIFGENCHIYDHNHKFRSRTDSIKSQGYAVGKTIIGKHCWLGSGVIVLKGVTIGDNCVIGAGCVVEEDVPENSILKNSQRNVVISKADSLRE